MDETRSLPNTQEQMLLLLEGKEIEHCREWCTVRDGKYTAAGETHDLRDMTYKQLRFLFIWVARDP